MVVIDIVIITIIIKEGERGGVEVGGIVVAVHKSRRNSTTAKNSCSFVMVA